jgi:transcription initiation factor TFIIIB Brf1 subunit/transcription initiation factor TFIIB
MLTNPLDLKECPDCASPNIGRAEARDQVICRDCGLIFEPLDPETEAQFEKTHDVTLGKPAKSAPKAKRKK